MKRLHVLTEEGSQSSIAFNFPLRLHRKLMAEVGLDVTIFLGAAEEGLFDCDVLVLNSNSFGSLWPGLRDDVTDVLLKGREQSGKVIWFDTSASSGTTQFDVMPYVDLYCKAQVLVDRRDYLKEYHGDRVFTDFYHRTAGVRDEDEDRAQRIPPRAQDLARIHVSWSTALGDFGMRARRYRRFGRYLPPLQRYSARFTSPDRPRPVKVSCRIGLGHQRATVLHHRRQIKSLLENELGLETHPIPREDYLRELREARVGVSPFGYGEVCFRDFEVILAGAALLKPDMSHLETWPPLYDDNVTYAAHRWDLEDLKEKLELLVSGRGPEIAAAAQKRYRKYLFEREGHEEFCSRLAEIVRAADTEPSSRRSRI